MDIKLTPYRRFVNFLERIYDRIFPSKDEVEEVLVNEFEQFFPVDHEIAEEYPEVNESIILCREALQIAKERVDLVKIQDEITLREQDLVNFEKLDDAEVDELKQILEKYQGVTNERQKILGQIRGCDKKVQHLRMFEAQVPEQIEEIDSAEKMKRNLGRDISYLEGEKGELEYEKTKLQTGVKLNRLISIVLIAVYSIMTIVLAVQYIFFQVEIFIWAFLLVISAVIFGTILLISRRRMTYELKINELKQQKAVQYLNKRKIHFARHTQFLNYEYKKFRIKSADMLKNNWGEYTYYRQLNDRYANINSIIYAMEKDLNLFLRKHGIDNTKSSIQKISEILSVDNKRLLHREIEEERVRIENQLSILDANQEKIWDQLMLLKERDNSPEKSVGQVVERYLNDVTKLTAEA